MASAVQTTPFQGMFSDVAEDAWYAAAVEWAAHGSIVMGKNAVLFAPDGQ